MSSHLEPEGNSDEEPKEPGTFGNSTAPSSSIHSRLSVPDQSSLPAGDASQPQPGGAQVRSAPSAREASAVGQLTMPTPAGVSNGLFLAPTPPFNVTPLVNTRINSSMPHLVLQVDEPLRQKIIDRIQTSWDKMQKVGMNASAKWKEYGKYGKDKINSSRQRNAELGQATNLMEYLIACMGILTKTKDCEWSC
ncbi:hypothetical protein CcaverHIS002_0311320 [Cutaneotrichosporon cavernicola]|uniref:Uncharacterized protein n=1 Tax=Cutaneotrichosporon cavernicola TaxID=279322 RepID=A0AA48L328_9TREE|nr:uncharacterized protein CcaverHIS019_0311180 [Cutaneotrichosporon cavernicola]BEI83264.1 hypothetical protein CcaverHIS002_0311320 [Cutaneotrichosporon cavernicola]BEI91048.1 hypothetical protein CcaverHIS019_0311180 [Cutaneotrichosporon cavernicola]